ncbi:PPM-type phosphatase domain-containing protein [Entamoeba marina]
MIKDVYDNQEELNMKLVIDPPNCYTPQYSLQIPQQEEDPEVYYTHHTDSTYASTIFSTYPTINEKKFGKPIADTHAIEVFDNFIILSIADGCGMGSLPSDAAQLACKSFKDFLSVELNGKKSPKQIIQVLLQSIAYIQTELIASGEDIHSVGLTTFLGCVILKIKGEDDKFAVAYVNVGDCRGVVMRPRSNICWELVSGYKPRIDVTNACGRLGPTDDDKPDLSNFACGMSICMSGDNLILMSDGIYDNFDPNVLGKSPQDFGINKNVWDETIPEHRKKRNEIFYSLLRELHTEVSPISLTQNVYDFVVEKTSGARQQKIDNQLGKYGFNIVPGKMDHSTFVSLVLSNDMFSIRSTIEEELDIPPDMM